MRSPVNGLEIFADSWLKKVFFNMTDAMMRYGIQTKTIRVSFKESEDGLICFLKGKVKGYLLIRKREYSNTGMGVRMVLDYFWPGKYWLLRVSQSGKQGAGKNIRFDIQVPNGCTGFMRISLQMGLSKKSIDHGEHAKKLYTKFRDICIQKLSFAYYYGKVSHFVDSCSGMCVHRCLRVI